MKLEMMHMVCLCFCDRMEKIHAFGRTAGPAGKDQEGQSILSGMTDWQPWNLASRGDELGVACVTIMFSFQDVDPIFRET